MHRDHGYAPKLIVSRFPKERVDNARGDPLSYFDDDGVLHVFTYDKFGNETTYQNSDGVYEVAEPVVRRQAKTRLTENEW